MTFLIDLIIGLVIFHIACNILTAICNIKEQREKWARVHKELEK
jgi:uncharacterized protein HemY